VRINLPLLLPVLLLTLNTCRGVSSRNPPIHLVHNMDHQARYNAQEANDFFEDGRAMRPQVPGTIARGQLKEDDHLYRGKKGSSYAEDLPMELTAELLNRGEDRYQIYCTVCHDGAGTGQGIVIQHGMVPPPSFHDERIRNMPVGQIFEVMSSGIRNMPSYKAQIPVKDRWAITAYVRALQISQHASIDLIPADEAAAKQWKK
jgi:hypothetical protein